MKVLITRAKLAAQETAQNLSEHGHQAICLPLFKVEDTHNVIPEIDYDGIVFTSKNAVEVLQTRNWKPKPGTPAFCVGSKTQKAALELGLKKTHTASGGGVALTKLMSKMKLSGQTMLYLSTSDKSFDMAEALEPHGVKTKTIDIYRAVTITPLQEDLAKAVSEISNAYIFVYSALSSKHLYNILHQSNLLGSLDNCTLVGISKQAIKPLEKIEWHKILIAKKPEEEEMIALIK